MPMKILEMEGIGLAHGEEKSRAEKVHIMFVRTHVRTYVRSQTSGYVGTDVGQ